MAIKKPITKRKPTAEVEEEEEEAPKKSFKKRATAEEDVEPVEEEEEEEKPKKKKSKKSLADIFDETTPQGGLFPVGDHKARIIGMVLEGEVADDPDEQGELKVKVTFEGHEDNEDVAEKTISNWYNIADENGDAGPGIGFLKRDLDILGYEDVKLEDLEEICNDIEKDRPEVVIKVKQNGQYTNAFLQGLADGD